MSKGQFSTLQAWSYSVYTQWLKCPFSVCLEKIRRVRIEEPPSSILTYGDATHNVSQLYVIGNSKVTLASAAKAAVKARKAMLDKQAYDPIMMNEVTNTMSAQKPLLDRLRKAKAQVELKWTFTKAYALTGWFAGDAWLRIIVDAMRHQAKPPEVEIIDYKTGKIYDDHKLQRKIYAMGGLQLVQLGQLAGGDKNVKVTASHVYVNGGATGTETFTMKDLEPLKREWGQRIKQMMSDTEFPVRPGPHCKWCKFAKSKGGPCKEG